MESNMKVGKTALIDWLDIALLAVLAVSLVMVWL